MKNMDFSGPLLVVNLSGHVEDCGVAAWSLVENKCLSTSKFEPGTSALPTEGSSRGIGVGVRLGVGVVMVGVVRT